MSSSLVPSVCTVLRWCCFCFSLTFQSQAQPLSSLTPWLPSASFPSSISHSSLHSRGWYSPRGEKKRREREGVGGSNHAWSYFLNDGDQSGGAGRREEEQIEVFEDRGRWAHSSPDCLILPSHWSGWPLALLMGVLSARHEWPFSPAAFKATMTAVITMYVKTCHTDFLPKVFVKMTVGT